MPKSLFVCKKCNYAWTTRKAVTRYQRQCPKCNSSDLDVGSPSQSQYNQAKVPTAANTVSIARTNLPKVIYDLVGISGASSPENAIQRAFELYRKLAPYKWKYNLSPEDVVEFLEKKAADADRRVMMSEKRAKELLDNPENIFWETIGADLTSVSWYEDEKKKGYDGSFLDFLSHVVERYYADRGLELPERED